VSDVPTLSVPVSADSVLPREKGVGFQLPDIATCFIPHQTFDDQSSVAPAPLSGVDVFMPDATITNPSPIASLQEYVLPDKSPPVEKSNAQILDEMMSSERGDCSPSPDLFVEEDVPLISPKQPVRISKATPLFPKPVSIIAGSRRQPNRAARKPADMLTEQLQSKEIQIFLRKQNPPPARGPSTKGVSSSGMISQYDTLPAATQHIRVDVVIGFEDTLKWKVDLDCTLAHPSITPVCEKRVNTLVKAQTMDFGGKCSFIHCPSQAIESILQKKSRSGAAHPETTSAILALPESDYSRLWDRMFHWKTLQRYGPGNRIFNQYESGELPRKCGRSNAYRIIYCPNYNSSQSVQPNIIETGDQAMLMMFLASLNKNKLSVGMDTMCQGPGFLTQSFCENASPAIPISLGSKDPNVTTLPTVVTGNGGRGSVRDYVRNPGFWARNYDFA
jgi:hypothetical protein